MTTSGSERALELYEQALQKQWSNPKDLETAARLYLEAAHLGFAGAQNNLGDLYDRGQSLPQSDVSAVYWYTRAAERGEPTAYLSLAAILSKTASDEAMLIEALKFATLARLMLSDGGNKDVAQVLQGLLMERLSSEARKAAYDLVEAWVPLFQEENLLSDSPAFTGSLETATDEAAEGNLNDVTFESLWKYCSSEGRAVPKDWSKFYKMLANKQQLPTGRWEPALPLILAAWHVTSALDKHLRFKEHVEWGCAHGQAQEIGSYLMSLNEDQWYHFGEL